MLTSEFIHALPKAELHLHLEGAIPWAIVRAHGGDGLPATPPWTAEGFRFADFTAFRDAVQGCMDCLVDARSYGVVAAAIFDGLCAQNVRYVELSFDIVRALDRGVALADIAAAIGAAVPAGLAVRVFAAFSQHKADRTSPEVVARVLATPGVHGVSLHGDETTRNTPRFAAAFADARRRGLLTKAHAGELLGPASVADALDRLDVRRIEHGVRAIEDAALVRRLAAEAITLDVCPWSNVRLGVVRDLATHPIRRLREAGVRITVNTDDPTIFGRTLTQELVSLVDDLGFAPAEVAALQANAFTVAAMPAEDRAAALAEIDALAREVGGERA